MNTRHTFTSLALVASLALAGPALAQSDPCRKGLKPGDLAKLGDLGRLADLADLDQLARLADRAPLGNLPALVDLAGVQALASLGDLADLVDLTALEQRPDARAIERTVRSSVREATHDLRSRGSWQARHPRGPQQTEKVAKTFRVGRSGTFYLSNMSGDITIKAGAGEDIVIDATKRAPQGPDAQRQLGLVTVDAVQQAGRIEVRTRYPEGHGSVRTSVDYTVTVPPGTSLDIHSMSGNVEIAGVKGGVRTECVSGNVQIEGADRLELVKTVSGDITVNGAAGTDIRVEGISGELTVRNVKARSLDVETISGDVKLTDVTAERAGVKTTSGDVDYVGPFARGGRYEFTAHSGDVRLTPTSNTGFEIDAQSFTGDVRCDLPMNLKPGASAANRRMPRQVKGTVGDGSALITVHTFNGDVTVVKKNEK